MSCQILLNTVRKKRPEPSLSVRPKFVSDPEYVPGGTCLVDMDRVALARTDRKTKFTRIYFGEAFLENSILVEESPNQILELSQAMRKIHSL